MNTSSIRMLGMALCVAVCGIAYAQGATQASAVQITNAVFQEVDDAAKGDFVKKLVPAKTVVPGDAVVYVISFSNKGKDAATDVVIDNPIPGELVFVDDSKTPATSVSVDNGKTFGALDTLFVLGADGEPRAARADDVTNLRWVMASLAPGTAGAVSYRARVK